MERHKFEALFPVIIGGLINKIIEETHVSEEDAFHKLYNSELYTTLEKEKTKIWTFSIPRLFELYKSEIATGELILPDY